MLFRFLAVLLGAAALSAPCNFLTDDFPLVPAQECHARAGLPHFFAKVAPKGTDVKIAYLGGSIAARKAGGRRRWPSFQKAFPTAKFSQINAAIGGTGSDLGVFRLKQDVLDARPDLLFVEFAVNDGGAPPAQIFRCMEGIVRQTWKALPGCDIAFVYTVTESLVGPFWRGNFPAPPAPWKRWRTTTASPPSTWAWKSPGSRKRESSCGKPRYPRQMRKRRRSARGWHLRPTASASASRNRPRDVSRRHRSLTPAIREASGKPAAHALKEPFIATNYENTDSSRFPPPSFRRALRRSTQLPIPSANAGPTAFRISTRPASRAIRSPSGSKAPAPPFTTSSARIAVRSASPSITGPHRASLRRLLHLSSPRHAIPRHRTARRRPYGEIKVHPDQPDKAAILAKRNEKIDKPERFDGRCFYPGAILLVGEIVE